MEKNFETLMEDKKFVEKIMQMESKEEVKKAFESEGVTITDEQLDSLGKVFNEIVEKLSTLNEDELRAIAGGVDNDQGVCWGAYSPEEDAESQGKARMIKARYDANVKIMTSIIDLISAGVGCATNRIKQLSAPNSKQTGKFVPPVVQNTTAGGASTGSNAKYYVAGATALAAAAGVGVYAFRKDIRRWFSK